MELCTTCEYYTRNAYVKVMAGNFSGHERQGYPKSLRVPLTERMYLNRQRYGFRKTRRKTAYEQDTHLNHSPRCEGGVPVRQSSHLIRSGPTSPVPRAAAPHIQNHTER
jgi:hypothetical protein